MKLQVKLSNERLITPSGLAMVGAVLAKSGFVKRINKILLRKETIAFYNEVFLALGEAIFPRIICLFKEKLTKHNAKKTS